MFRSELRRKRLRNSKVDDFVKIIEDYKEKARQGMKITDLIDSILNDTGYREELEQEGEIESETRIENIEELKSKAAAFESEHEDEYGEHMLSEFLSDVALVADVDSFDESVSRVTLMTLHGAKGLEFPHVYMTGMEEGLFPSSMSINSDDRSELEEERRICYVGITRAKDLLTMTFARSRMVNGETIWSKASRFIDEIPDEFLEKHLLEKNYSSSTLYNDDYGDLDYERGLSQSKPSKKQPASGNKFGGFSRTTPATYRKAATVTKADHLDYCVGDTVAHTKFGVGTVIAIEEGERDYEVTVDFGDFGTRHLFAAFAKLQKV